MNSREKRVLNEIQDGIPLVERPFKEIAEKLGLREEEVLHAIDSLEKKDKLRRFGGIFDVNKLGVVSTLACMKVDEVKIREVVDILNKYRGITHNYKRNEEHNIWFTVMESSEEQLEDTINEITQRTGIEVISLPSIKKYRTKVFLSF